MTNTIAAKNTPHPRTFKNKGWLRANVREEYQQFQQGRITRSEFPMGGYLYQTRITPDDGKTLYSGNDYEAAYFALPAAKIEAAKAVA